MVTRMPRFSRHVTWQRNVDLLNVLGLRIMKLDRVKVPTQMKLTYESII